MKTLDWSVETLGHECNRPISLWTKTRTIEIVKFITTAFKNILQLAKLQSFVVNVIKLKNITQ